MGAALLATVLSTLGITPEMIAARGLEPVPEPALLVIAEIANEERVHRLTPEAADAWQRMKAAAAADGVPLRIVSAFRSVSWQAEIIRRKLAEGQPIEEILKVNAPPGYSDHHSGRAVDVNSLETAFERSAAFRWLTEHAGSFGFHMPYTRDNPQGYDYEPWHWVYLRAPR